MKNIVPELKEMFFEKISGTLLNQYGKTTTLDVTKKLREEFPEIIWDQTWVSEKMMPWVEHPNVSFRELMTDTEPQQTYREYFIVQSNVSKHDKIVQALKETNGKFFNIKFTKQDGTTRAMNARLFKSKLEDCIKDGVVTLYDMQILQREHPDVAIRSCKVESIQSIQSNGQPIQVFA